MTNNQFYYKLGGWYLLIALLAWGFFDYVNNVLNIITPESFTFDFKGIVIINFIFLVSVVSLGLVLFKEKKWTLYAVGVVGLLYLVIFGWTYLNLIGIGIIALLFLLARNSGVGETDHRVKINFWSVSRKSAPAVITGFFILMSFAAYSSPVLEIVSTSERLPTASEVFIRNIIDSTIGRRVEDPGQREQVVGNVASDTIGEINTFLQPYFKYAPPALAFGLLVVLSGLNWIFVWLSSLVGMGIFFVLKKYGFVKVEEYNTKAEKIAI